MAARVGERPDRLFRQAVPGVSAARVVEGQPSAVRADQVDRALGAGGLRDRGEGDAVFAVQGADEVALGVLAEEVDVVGAQAEAAQTDGHEVPGLSGAGADP